MHLRADPSASARPGWRPFIVLLLALSATAAATAYVHVTSRTRDQQRFERAAHRIANNIEGRIEASVTMLRGAAGLFATDELIDRHEFRAYVDRLQFQEHFPGIQGIGFSARVRPDEVAKVVARERQQGLADFHIWPETPRQEYHSILYLEPPDARNRAAIGYDMFTDPTRRAAMIQARDSGQAAATGKVTLVQEIDVNKQAGFLIYLPVYRGGTIPTTVEERRQELRGFVYSPFRVDDLLEGIFGPSPAEGVGYSLYDGTELSPAALMHRSHSLAAQGDFTPALSKIEAFEVAGRPWTLLVQTDADFAQGSSSKLTPLTLLCGLGISAILFILTRSEAQARARAELVAHQLQASEQQREQLLVREQVARHEAEEANRMKDQFLAMVSHELRTPLNAILGWAQMLQEGAVDAESTGEAIDAIERNARTQAQLINDLLDLSRIARGQLHLEKNLIELRPVVEAAIAAVAPLAQKKELTIGRDFDPSLGRVLGDATRLQQVVWNLLTNAVKFTPHGGQIDVSLQRQGDSAVVTVRDTGSGIKPDFLPHVFEPFRQAEGSGVRKHGGLGLGLAIVRQLVELHGGTVEAHSDGPGRGATFTVRLPLAHEAAVAEKTIS